MRFQGKVSWWFYAIMIGTAALLIPLIVVSAWIDPNGVVLAVDLFVFAALESFCASIVLRNYVELQKDSLRLCSVLSGRESPIAALSRLPPPATPHHRWRHPWTELKLHAGTNPAS